MLLDEPVSGLDPINARRIMDLIIRAQDLRKVASLYVIKELNEISYLANHYAIEGEDRCVSICEGIREQAPETKVLLLEEGKVGFFFSNFRFRKSSIRCMVVGCRVITSNDERNSPLIG